MLINEQQLAQIFPKGQAGVGAFVTPLNAAMQAYDINTPARAAAFIAQVGFESACFCHLVEVLNHSAERLAAIWPNRFCTPDGKPNALALQLGGHPEAIANSVYANRLGNGAPESGDGWRFRGRGLIQLTGRTNYQQAGAALKVDLEAQPELLEQPQYACLTAAWFWSVHGLNTLADSGDFKAITQRINGGLNGYDARAALWSTAREVIV
jgi:putative chitinase